MLHTGIALFMGLNTFSMMMIAMVLSFVPPEALGWFVRALGRGAPRLALGFNGRVPAQARVASAVRAFDAWDQVVLADRPAGRRAPIAIPAEPARQVWADSECLELTTEAGETLTGYTLFERLVRSVRLLWPLAVVTWVPGVAALARAWFPASPAQAARADEVRNGRRKANGERVTR
jgi:hypothetical protein